jgi:hypothetical protein
MSGANERARACYLECEQMDSDGIVETISKYLSAEVATLASQNEALRNSLTDLLELYEVAVGRLDRHDKEMVHEPDTVRTALTALAYSLAKREATP